MHGAGLDHGAPVVGLALAGAHSGLLGGRGDATCAGRSGCRGGRPARRARPRTRQASITLALIQPGMRDWRPHSPNETWLPRCATPRIVAALRLAELDPLGHRRHVRQPPGGPARRPAMRAGVDPALDADRPVGRLRGRGAVARCRPCSVESGIEPRICFSVRAISAPPRRPATTSLMPLRAALHRLLDRALHRAAERRPASSSCSATPSATSVALSSGLAISRMSRPTLRLRSALELRLELLGLHALAADQDAGLRRVDDDAQGVGLALDLDLRDAGARELLLDEVADLAVLLEEAREVLLRGVPPGLDQSR